LGGTAQNPSRFGRTSIAREFAVSPYLISSCQCLTLPSLLLFFLTTAHPSPPLLRYSPFDVVRAFCLLPCSAPGTSTGDKIFYGGQGITFFILNVYLEFFLGTKKKSSMGGQENCRRNFGFGFGPARYICRGRGVSGLENTPTPTPMNKIYVMPHALLSMAKMLFF
jgi:hypothetical protein